MQDAYNDSSMTLSFPVLITHILASFTLEHFSVKPKETYQGPFSKTIVSLSLWVNSLDRKRRRSLAQGDISKKGEYGCFLMWCFLVGKLFLDVLVVTKTLWWNYNYFPMNFKRLFMILGIKIKIISLTYFMWFLGLDGFVILSLTWHCFGETKVLSPNCQRESLLVFKLANSVFKTLWSNLRFIRQNTFMFCFVFIRFLFFLFGLSF